MVYTLLKHLPGRSAVALLLVVLSAAGCLPARAELPPGSYDKLRSEAKEALTIKVLDVTTKEKRRGEVDVVLKARVQAVKRSRSGLKKGSTIQIRYTSIDANKLPDYAGADPVAILKKGIVLCARGLRGEFQHRARVVRRRPPVAAQGKSYYAI